MKGRAGLFSMLLCLFAMFLVAPKCDGGDDSSSDGDSDDDSNVDDDDSSDDDSGGDTWTDPNTNLMWEVKCGNWQKWDDAITYCEALVLNGYDDWRLPNIDELRTLIRGCPSTESGGACGVTTKCLFTACWNNCGECSWGEGPVNGCFWPEELVRPDCVCIWLWSINEVRDLEDAAWTVNFENAWVDWGHKDYPTEVICVR